MVPDIGGGSDWTWMLVSILIFVNQHGHLLVVATCVGAVCGQSFPLTVATAGLSVLVCRRARAPE